MGKLARVGKRLRLRKRRPFSWRRALLAWSLPILFTVALLAGLYTQVHAATPPTSSELATYLQSNALTINTDLAGSYLQVYYYYNNKRYQLTSDNYNHVSVAESGANIVWVGLFPGYNLLYLYNILSNTTTQLTASGSSEQPYVYGNQVVWQEWDGQHWQVWYYDGSQEYQITNGADSSMRPSTNGSQIIYAEQIGTDTWKAQEYDISTGQTTMIAEGSTATTAYPQFNADGSIATAFVPY